MTSKPYVDVLLNFLGLLVLTIAIFVICIFWRPLTIRIRNYYAKKKGAPRRDNNNNEVINSPNNAVRVQMRCYYHNDPREEEGEEEDSFETMPLPEILVERQQNRPVTYYGNEELHF